MALSLTGPVQILNQLLGNQTQQYFNFSPSNTLRSTLELNQVVSGVVERDLGQGKYIVQIRGENLVFESKAPLKLNDIIHGRVIGIGDKVELQRIFKEKAAADKQNITQQNLDYLYTFGKAGYRAAVILQNYRVSLSADEQQALIATLKTTDLQDTLALTAVVLNKMGVTVTQDALNTLHPLLSNELKQKFNLQNITANIDFSTNTETHNDKAVIQELAEFIHAVVDRFPHATNRDAIVDTPNYGNTTGQQNTELDMGMSHHQNQSEDRYFDPSRILLNAQSDGSISHRVSVVPFMVNDQLVEVDVALFSQKQSVTQLKNNHRRIVLSLDMDTLGKIEAELNIVGKHARVNINTENSLITNELVKFMPNLRQDFENNDFKIDELSYGIKQKNTIGNVIGSVVEHYITQDSLSRLY